MVGAPGTHTWIFAGNASGVVELNFVYSRSFENNTTVENLTYVIDVKDDKSMEILSVSSPEGNLLPLYKTTTVENNSSVLKMVSQENPTTGYAWNVTLTPTDVLNKTRDFYDAPTTEAAGAPGAHTWEFDGLKAGTANVTLSYLRSFEADKPIENAVYNINVYENKTLEIVGISFDTLTWPEA